MNNILDKLGVPYKRNNKDIILEDFNINPIKVIKNISYISTLEDNTPFSIVYCIDDDKFYVYDVNTEQYKTLDYI